MEAQMSEAAEKLKTALLELPEAERWELLDALMKSLPKPPGVFSADDPGFDAELDRRRVEHESGADPGIPADEFFRKLREKRS
jgi:putative addiction module component (TIGR02574 family)